MRIDRTLKRVITAVLGKQQTTLRPQRRGQEEISTLLPSGVRIRNASSRDGPQSSIYQDGRGSIDSPSSREQPAQVCSQRNI